ncbi:hypothetical protein [Rhodococcus sp. IEGM 1408]|uniref:hypothetical protein n=1 Tax=Rhodococcus sp. IEGM 1408 TaxID=3082220 RepID=UPI002953972E|nr:hypothetical protein [Rhodococcus sp. IEGM 1408]MDV8000753.1 hypothetical protein [Rhodococcus sp. IEGM 1408]
MRIEMSKDLEWSRTFGCYHGYAPFHVVLAALHLDPGQHFDVSVVERLSGEEGTTWRFAWLHEGVLGIVESSSAIEDWSRSTDAKLADQPADTRTRLVPLKTVDTLDSKITDQHFEHWHNRPLPGDQTLGGEFHFHATVDLLTGDTSVFRFPLVPPTGSAIDHHPTKQRDRERSEEFEAALVGAWKEASK